LINNIYYYILSFEVYPVKPRW